MHGANGYDLNIGLMLGRLLQGQETTNGLLRQHGDRLDQIDTRLAHGDQEFQNLREELKAAKEAGQVAAWVKDLARYLVPLGVLWLTGSIDAAVKMSGIVK